MCTKVIPGRVKMVRNKVITMTDSKYFQYGQRLLDTRHIVDADFVCYGPDLSTEQRDILKAHDIQHKKVNQDIWDAWMQSLKFQFVMDEIDLVSGGGVTFVDWDTYFLKDWGGIFYRAKWDFGVTIRSYFIEKYEKHWAWSNGGVIFATNTSKGNSVCEWALQTIDSGDGCNLPEYDEIWQMLENGRAPEKTHYRSNKRWWCDQVFLSALVMRKRNKGDTDGYDIKLFDCKQYNNLWEETPDTYIMHLKEKSGAPSSFKDGK